MIDWTQLTQLRDEIGSDGFDEVVALFLGEAEDTIVSLAAPDAAPPEEAYHALKGSALNLGMPDFARICADAEIAAREGRPVPDADWLLQVFRREKTLFLREIGDRFPP